MKMHDKFLVLGLFLFCLFLISLLFGLRFNLSHSFPPGIYWLDNVWPQKGDLVVFCPPNTDFFKLAKDRGFLPTGRCPGNYRPLIKKIVAVSGDKISINAKGVFVNGEKQQNSRPLKADLNGLPLPTIFYENYILPDGKVLLLSDYHPLSFDGRYTGLADASSIQGKLNSLMTW